MRLLRNIATGLRSLIRKKRVEKELDDELRGFLADIEARAVVAGSGDGAVVDAAAGLGVPILTCSVAPTGVVLLEGNRPAASPSATEKGRE